MRKLIFGIIIVIALVVVFMRGDSLVELVATMQQGSAIPLLIAIAVQFGKYISQSFAFSNSFKTVGEAMRPKDTINLVFGMFFMNTVAPSVGVSGVALVVDDARRRGIPAGRATSAAILMQASVDTGFLVIMLAGFLVLAATGNFSPWWLIAALVDMAIVGVAVLLLVLGKRSPATLSRILVAIEGFANKVLAKFKKEPKYWAENLVRTFGEASGDIARNPRKAAKVFACSILASACELTCFIMCGISFGVDKLPALIGGYIIATLFAMVSITPQGVGFVETAVLVFLTAYGINSAAATAVGIVYRGIVFWMPFLIGAVLINKTKTFEHVARSDAGDGEQPVAVAKAGGNAAGLEMAQPMETGDCGNPADAEAESGGTQAGDEPGGGDGD